MSGRWRMRFDVSSVFHNPDLTFEQKRDGIAAALRAHPWAKVNGYVADLADEIADTTDGDAFDVVWDALYDEADAEGVWVVTTPTVEATR